MEPPPKRIRLSKDETAEHQATDSFEDAERPLNVYAEHDGRVSLRPTPTRPTDPHAFRRRFLPDNRFQPVRRNLGNNLVLRVPDSTITASVLDIAVNDGSAITQIAVPTKNVAIDVTNLGTLTVPGAGSTVSSITQSLLSSRTSSSLSSTTGSLLSSSRANNTSSSPHDRTMTVTATSTFHVSYRNGTFIEPSSSQSSTSFATDASTTDDSSSSSPSTTGPVFGEGVTYTPSPTATYNQVGLGGASTSSTTSSSATSSHTQNANNGPVLTQQQAQVVGGVVGSVAGVAVVLVILLYFLRWYRQRLKSQGRLPEQLSSNYNLADAEHPPPDTSMSQSHQSLVLASPFAQSLKRWRTQSQYTVATNSTSTTAAESEKSFQKIAGRKIPPALLTGGDGYGSNFGAFQKDICSSPSSDNRREHTLSRSSFYRDSGGFYSARYPSSSVSEPGTPSLASFIDPNSGRIHKAPSFSAFANNTSTRDFAANHPVPLVNLNSVASAFAANSSKPDGFAMMRSSPARTPITQSPSSTTYRMPIHAPVTMDDDVPEMPLTPPPMMGLGLRPSTERHERRISSHGPSSPGKFKENI